MLVCVPFNQDGVLGFYTLVLPEPWLTQEGPMTSLVSALYQLFVRSCDLAHDGQHCSHFCANTHRSLLLHLSLWCLRLSISVLRWKSIKMCGRLLAPLSGITLTIRATHSLHYTPSNSFMMIRSPRLCSHWSLPRRPNGTTSSGSVSGPQLPHSLISSHVPAGPARNVTGEAMPTSLAEAVTQLSFLEFLQRCNLLIAPLQLPQLPVPISLLDAAAQTTPPCDASQDASTQTSDQPVSSLCGSADDFPQCPFLIPGYCCADDPTQYSFSGRFYADGFSPSFLVFS